MLGHVRTASLSPAPLSSWATPGWGGEIDIYETDTTVFAQVSVPGVRAEQIDVQEHDGVLTVHVEQVDERRDGQLHARQTRIWERRIRLPATVQSNGAEATLRDGVLTITLPKTSSSNVRRIPVNGVQARPQLPLPRPGWMERLGQWLHWSRREPASPSRTA